MESTTDSADDLVELSGIISRGIEAANERAHTGSGDVVHGDMVLLEPADDANVSQSEGAAAFEDKCNSRSRFRSCFLCDSRGGQECQRQQKADGFGSHGVLRRELSPEARHANISFRHISW